MAGTSTTPSQALREWTILGTLLALALVLRLVALGRESFWLDEAFTAFLSAAPLADILAGRAGDGANPQGFWALGHVWRALVGDSDYSLRLLSVLIGTASVGAVYALGRLFGGVPLARLSALLLAINPAHIYLSQEFRVYVLLFLISAIILMAAHRYRENQRNAALFAYVVAASAGMYLHYYAALSIIAVNLWMLPAWRERRLFLRWCLAQLLALALIVPLLSVAVVHAAARVHADGGGAASQLHLFATPLTLMFGRTLVWKSDGAVLVAAGVVLAALLLVMACWFGSRRRFAARGLLIAATAVPLALAAILATFADMQSWDDRKALVILAPVLVMLAQGLLAAPRPLRALMLSLIVCGSVFSWARYLHTDNRDNWRQVGATLSARLLPSDAVVVVPDFELISLARYCEIANCGATAGVRAWGYWDRGEYVCLGPLRTQSVGQRAPVELAQAQRIWIVRNALMDSAEVEPVLRELGISAVRYKKVLPRSLEVSLYVRDDHR